MELAQRLRCVQPSPTKAMTQKARQLKQSGRDIITLSQGEPDFDTPAHIIEAATVAMNNGVTRYTEVAGMLSLREAIAANILASDGVHYAPEELTVGCGAKQVVFNALMALLSEGDEVLIPAPYWVSYPDMVYLCGGTPDVISCDAGTGYKLTAEALTQSITPRTRCLLLNSPNNPSGAVYTADELAALAEVLEAHPRVAVISDEIYRPICYREPLAPSMMAHRETLRDRLIVINGVSKAYAMTGWRVGYGAGPGELIKAMNVIQSQASSHTSSISQAAAEAAYRGGSECVREFTAAFRSRRDRVVQALKEVPGMEFIVPDGAFYLFVSCRELIGTHSPDGRPVTCDLEVAEYLLEYHDVAVVPGSAFGAPGHLRISYALDEATLATACRRIAEAYGALRKTRQLMSREA